MPTKETLFDHKKQSGLARRPRPVSQLAEQSETQSNTASVLQRAQADPSSLTAHEVLDLQRTVGNQTVTRLLGNRQGQSAQQRVQRHNDGTVHTHPGGGGGQGGPQSPSGSYTQSGVSGLDLLANTMSAPSTLLDMAKPVAEGLGAVAGLGSGALDMMDPQKDKLERGLGGAGALTSAVQIGSQLGALGATAGEVAGGSIMPGLDVVSGGYKAGKSLWDASTVKAAQTKAKALGVSAASDGKAEIKSATDTLDKIAGYRLTLNKWDTGTGAVTLAGGGMALGGATTLNPVLAGAGTVVGAAGKMAGSDLLWKGLQWASGSRVWSNDKYNEEIKKLEDQLVAKIDSIIETRNSKIAQLGDLYQAAKDIAPTFAEGLKTKALASRTSTATHRAYFD
ncbi:MAG: hypothetical protein ACYDEO_17355 [Aggregatilineales bacterium]